MKQIATEGDTFSLAKLYLDTLAARLTDSVFVKADMVFLQDVLISQGSGDVFYVIDSGGDTIFTLDANNAKFIMTDATEADSIYFTHDGTDFKLITDAGTGKIDFEDTFEADSIRSEDGNFVFSPTTDKTTMLMAVVNDSLRVEETARIKGTATFGATATPVVINSKGATTMSVGGTSDGLSIDGNKTSGNLAQFINDNDGSVGDSSVVVTSKGWVGIGKSPSAKFQVRGDFVLGIGGSTDDEGLLEGSGSAITFKNSGGGRGIRITTNTASVGGATAGAVIAGQAGGIILSGDAITSHVGLTTSGALGIGTTAPVSKLDQGQFSADAVGSYHSFTKSRHATAGSHTIVQDNDVVGGINFAPSDGTDFGTISAQIKAEVDDAAPAASSIGGALVFSTAAGAASDDLTERMRIDAAGTTTLASGSAFKVGAAQWDVAGTDSINGASIGAGTIPATGLVLLKDLVSGTGLDGGVDNILPGTDSDVTLNVLVDYNGGLEIADDSVNIKLDGATLTLGASGLKVTDNTYQPLDADLTALAGLASTGLVARTAGNTYSERTLTGTTAQITVTNGDGVSANPTLSLPDTLNIDTSALVYSPIQDSLYVTDLKVDGTATLDAVKTNSIAGASPISLDVTGTGNSYVEVIQDNNAGYLAIGRTTGTEASMITVCDGGADNAPGFWQMLSDDGNGNYHWHATDHVYRVAASLPADDDAGGYAIIDADDGTIGGASQLVIGDSLNFDSNGLVYSNVQDSLYVNDLKVDGTATIDNIASVSSATGNITTLYNSTTTNGDGFPVNNYNTVKVYCDSTIAGEVTLSNVLPAGYTIETIIFKNTTANEITNLDIGFSDGGGEIVAAGNVTASDEGSFTILQKVDDFDAADTIYISAANWNSANLIIWIRMQRMF